MINPEEVCEMFEDCLFREDEVEEKDGKRTSKEGVPMVMAEGIRGTFGFHKERLMGHKKQIVEWLNQLPDEFHQYNEGGWTFLNACNLKNGDQWTGLHERVEQLLVMGIGIGRVHWMTHRNTWKMFPGGMPYAIITTPKIEDMDKKDVEKVMRFFEKQLKDTEKALEDLRVEAMNAQKEANVLGEKLTEYRARYVELGGKLEPLGVKMYRCRNCKTSGDEKLFPLCEVSADAPQSSYEESLAKERYCKSCGVLEVEEIVQKS